MLWSKGVDITSLLQYQDSFAKRFLALLICIFSSRFPFCSLITFIIYLFLFLYRYVINLNIFNWSTQGIAFFPPHFPATMVEASHAHTSLCEWIDKSTEWAIVFWEAALGAVRILEQCLKLTKYRCCSVNNFPLTFSNKSQMKNVLLFIWVLPTGPTARQMFCWFSMNWF